MRRIWLLLVIFCGFGLTATGCGYLKASRILAPELSGLTCATETICIDDMERLPEAQALEAEATAFVQESVGVVDRPPRIHFCSTKSCFSKFGNPQVAALYFWGAGIIVINDIGWEPYIVRHEMIHHWQASHFGLTAAASRLPKWYIEGMAYVQSNDPREDVTNAQANAYRDQYLAWIEQGNDWRIPPE